MVNQMVSIFSGRKRLAISQFIAVSLLLFSQTVSADKKCCDGSVVSCPAEYVSVNDYNLVSADNIAFGTVTVARSDVDVTVSFNMSSCAVIDSVSMWLSQEPLSDASKSSSYPYQYSLSPEDQRSFSAVFKTAALLPASTSCSDSVFFAFHAKTKCVCSGDAVCSDSTSVSEVWAEGSQVISGQPFDEIAYCCKSESKKDVSAQLLEKRQAAEVSTTGEVGTTGEDDDEGTTGEQLAVSSTTGEATPASQSTGEQVQLTTGEQVQLTTGEELSGSATTGDESSAGVSTTGAFGPQPAPVTGTPDVTFIMVFWSPSGVKRDVNTGSNVVLESSLDNSQFNQIYSGPAVSFQFNHTDLESATQYYYRVFLTSAGGVSPYSDVTALSTLSVSTGGATTASSTNTSDPASNVNPEVAAGVGKSSSGLSGGVIAGIVIAVCAVAAAIAAVVAKTAFKPAAPAAGHWLDSAVQNPLYQAGEQAFENPLYDPPAEAAAGGV